VSGHGGRLRVALVSLLAGLGAEHLEPIEESFEVVDRRDLDATSDEEALIAGLAGVWGVIAGSETYTARVLSALPDLRIVARCGVGFDAVDLEAATAHGIAVTTTPDANSEGVADLALALMLACLRRIVPTDRGARGGAWRRAVLSGDLAGATVGIVGLGRVGRRVALRLRGFDCRLLAFEPFPDLDFCREHGVELVELDALLREADVVTVHVPLTDGTRRLLGARELELLKPSAVVVNTSRGTVFDEAALVEALASGRIAGAGLDVYEREPLAAGHPLTALDNVVLSTHSASFTRLSVARMLAAIHESLSDAEAGRRPHGLVEL
jgi:D-3-phosphoglycerate dehydrogenase